MDQRLPPDDDDHTPLMLFGRDVSKIPCFRNTFLYSISIGIGSGLVAFLLTSKPMLATNVAAGSYVTSACCYWGYCRWRYSMSKFTHGQLQMALQKKMIMGNDEEREEIRKNIADA